MQKITCPTCAHTMVLDDSAEDRIAECTKCGAEVDVPASVSSASSAVKSPRRQSATQQRQAASAYSPAGIIIFLQLIGWLTFNGGIILAIAGIIYNFNYFMVGYGIGVMVVGIFDLLLASFLTRLDRAAHKILAS